MADQDIDLREIMPKSERKAIRFYLSKEEQKTAVKESTSYTTDILDMIDKLNFAHGAITSTMSEAIKLSDAGMLDLSSGDTWKRLGSAAVKGITRKEKKTLEDVWKQINPELMNEYTGDTYGEEDSFIEKAGWFIGDVAIDPLTWITFGMPVKAAKFMMIGGKRGIVKASKELLPASTYGALEKATGKITEKTAKILEDKIYPVFNIEALWRAKGKGTGIEKNLVKFMSAKSVIEGRGNAILKDVATIAEKRNIVGGVSRTFMDEAGGKLLTDTNRKTFDRFRDLFEGTLAGDIKMSVDDYIGYTDIESKIDDILEAGGKLGTDLEQKAAEDAIIGIAKDMKTSTGGAISRMLLEQKGFKELSNRLAKVDRETIDIISKQRYDIGKKFYSETSKNIQSKIDLLEKAAKSETKILNKMFGKEIDDAIDIVDGIKKDFTKMSTEALPEISMTISNSIDILKTSFNMFDKTFQRGLVKDTFKAGEKMHKVKFRIQSLETEMARLKSGMVDSTEKVMKQKINVITRDLKEGIREYNKAFTLAKNEIKGNFKATKQLQDDVVKVFADENKKLLGQMTENAKLFKNETMLRKYAKDASKRYESKMKSKYHRAFNELRKGAVHQRVALKLMGKKKKILQEAADSLPPELRDSFWKIRNILDEQGDKLAKAGIINKVDLYFPRAITPETVDKISKTLPQNRAAAGLVKHRKFKQDKEFKKWVEDQGGETFDDAAILTSEHVKQSDMKLARWTLEEEIKGKLGLKSIAELDPKLKASLNYLYTDGKTRYNLKPVDWLMKGYNSVLSMHKTALTIINPAFYGRNILGFPFLSANVIGMKQGLNPANYADALMIKVGREGHITTKAGKKLSYKEIREAAEESGYFASSWTRGDLKQSSKQALGRYKWTDPRRWAAEVFSFSMHTEDIGRYGALMGALKTGRNMDDAIRAAKKAMFDYNLINSPVDKMLQGFCGFYTFSRRNLPNQIGGILNDPKQYATFAKLMNHFSRREDLTDEEMLLMNQWDKASFKFFGKNVDGLREFVKLGFTPIEEAGQTINALLSGNTLKERAKSILGSKVNPLMATFMDWYYSKDSFRGVEFGNSLPAKYSNIIPDAVAGAFGLTKQKKDKWQGGAIVGEEEVLYGDPDVIFSIMRLPPTSRFLGDLASVVTAAKEGEGFWGTMKYALGMKKSKLDIDKLRRMDKRRKKEALIKAGQAKGMPTSSKRPYVRKEHKRSR